MRAMPLRFAIVAVAMHIARIAAALARVGDAGLHISSPIQRMDHVVDAESGMFRSVDVPPR
jgi:hypothetical protein